ncbi:high mobility group B protein 14 isoform X2 [Solanum tuberosum]|uniref:high mobility group B protein 14 isoform X2 n=1 Tax=Solanum tuberosum TaxID=4113 RepID=UPI00073A3D97|nr:PREDICTED: high mobility group B protein 14 isoform X2 [Solanum tuberosum]
MAKKASSKCRNSSASTSTSTSLSRTATKRVKSAEKVKAGGVKQSKPTSKKKPKKPPTAFFYFLEDFRKEFQEQNPDVRSMRDIGKACGEKWKIMTYEFTLWFEIVIQEFGTTHNGADSVFYQHSASNPVFHEKTKHNELDCQFCEVE